jgi:hypothetical protein
MTPLPLVKCAECGFLAMRENTAKGKPELEVSPEMRKIGRRPYALISSVPYCYLGVIDLPSKCRAKHKPPQFEEMLANAFKETINEPVKCDEFYKYNQGDDPPEHCVKRDKEREEMRELLILREEQQRQRELDLERTRQEKELADAKEERRIKEEREYKAKQDWNNWLRGLAASVIIALLVAILAVVTEPWKARQQLDGRSIPTSSQR